jgi:hypothetical protein
VPYNLPPPSGFTGQQRRWLELVQAALNATPVFSWGSFATPNSNVSGVLSDFFINTGSASTETRLFMKVGPASGTVSNISWATVRILPN